VPEKGTLDFDLDRMKFMRDKLISHREYIDLVAPRPSLELLEDGDSLLPLAMELYDQVAPLTYWIHRFSSNKESGDGELISIQHIAKQFANVVSGQFASRVKEKDVTV
jgi:hypothetical protein